MTNNDDLAQKELYAKVEKQAHSLRGNPLEYMAITGMCPVNVIEMHAQKIQALLAERDAKDARIADLEAGHAEAAKQITSWRRLAKQNIDEHEKAVIALDDARQRIAELEAKNALVAGGISATSKLYDRIHELEARTVSVKLPDSDEYLNKYDDRMSDMAAYENAVCRVLLDAGINLEIK